MSCGSSFPTRFVFRQRFQVRPQLVQVVYLSLALPSSSWFFPPLGSVCSLWVRYLNCWLLLTTCKCECELERVFTLTVSWSPLVQLVLFPTNVFLQPFQECAKLVESWCKRATFPSLCQACAGSFLHLFWVCSPWVQHLNCWLLPTTPLACVSES